MKHGGAQGFGEGDQVVDAKGIDFQGFVEGRIKIDDARDINHRRDFAFERFDEGLGQAHLMHDHIACDGRDFFSEEAFEAFARIKIADRIEGGRGCDLRPETFFGALIGLGPDDEVEMVDFGIAVKKLGDPHFAQKTRAADDDESLSGEDLRRQKRSFGCTAWS